MQPSNFWTLDRLANALRARSKGAFPGGETPLCHISTDTRTLHPGDCFVALVGDQFDAHDFLDQAAQSGAAALVVSRVPPLRTYDIPMYQVDNTLVALGDLARYWRAAWGRPVIGIAGSNGKTSTKELVRAALGTTFEVHATTGNLNNRVGVPFTLLSMPATSEIAVVEIGTSLPGEVALLRDIACPDIAIVTSIAEEHLEGLGDLDGVLREEAAIFDSADIAIVPSSQPEIAAAAAGRSKRIIQAGLETGDVRADRWSIDPDGCGTIVFGGVTVRPPIRGVHNLRNAMLALATAQVCGVDIQAATRGIETMPLPSMRATWQQIGRATVINDAYNSNPGSARAALDMLTGVVGAQRVAILGTMRELGSNAAHHHDDVARAALASSADLIAGIGEFSDALGRVAPHDPRVIVAPDVNELWPMLAPRLAPDATILLKASRGVRLERILPHITTWAAS